MGFVVLDVFFVGLGEGRTRTIPSMCPEATTALTPVESVHVRLTSRVLHFEVARIMVVVASQQPR